MATILETSESMPPRLSDRLGLRRFWNNNLNWALLLIGAGYFLWFARSWSVAFQSLAWGIILTAVACLLKSSGIRVFGPLLLYDMVRTARRRQFVVDRCILGLVLLFGLFSVWFGSTIKNEPRVWSLLFAPSLGAKDIAQLNSQFFSAVMGLQLLAAFVLTPAYAGGTLAKEKECRTLQHLLLTDLTNQEIVLSMLASKLANVALLLLMSLGILALLPLLGGVDPGLLLAGYAFIGLTILSLASLSILNSVLISRFQISLIYTYLTAFGYLVFTTGVKLLYDNNLTNASLPVPWPQQVVNWLSAGNIVTTVLDLKNAVENGASLDQLLPSILGAYALFHLLIAIFCTSLAVSLLRTSALEEAAEPEPTKGTRGCLRTMPATGIWSMVWKEVFSQPKSRRRWLARFGAGLLVTASFIPAAYYVYHFSRMRFPEDNWDQFRGLMNYWVRHATNIMACLMLLQVTSRAALSISRERDRQTLDTLLTTPLGATGILFAKWLGSILSLRWTCCWLGSIWLTAYLCGALDYGAIIPRLSGWLLGMLVFAGFQAAIGLCFSIACSTQRAVLWSLLTTVALCCGHWLAWAGLCPFFAWAKHERHIEEFARAYGLTPSLAILELTRRTISHGTYKINSHVWFGVILWGVVGAALWYWASRRFRRACNRSGRFPSIRQTARPN